MNVLVMSGWVKLEHDESGFVQFGIKQYSRRYMGSYRALQLAGVVAAASAGVLSGMIAGDSIMEMELAFAVAHRPFFGLSTYAGYSCWRSLGANGIRLAPSLGV